MRAFLKFAGRRDDTALHAVEQALGVPMKRFERPMLGFLAREEMLAIIGEPGRSWTSQRDHLLLRMLYNTGARVSEITAIRLADVVRDGAACVHLHGKGRKQRTVPLWRSTVKQTKAWLKLNPQFEASSPLLPNRAGQAMTRGNVAQRLALAVRASTATQPQLAKRRISPHTVRHTTAMHLLQSGVDITVIALWLGHESTETTQMYLHADMRIKERAPAHATACGVRPKRYRPPDTLLAGILHPARLAASFIDYEDNWRPGRGPITTLVVRFDISDGYSDDTTITLDAGAQAMVEFALWTANTSGSLATKCSTQFNGDMYPANDKVAGSVFVQYLDVQTIGIISPTGNFYLSDTATPQVTIRNNGNTSQTFL